MKHKKQYFEGQLSGHLIKSMLDYYPNLTNKNLAKKIGVSERTLYYIKKGEVNSTESKKKIKSLMLKLKDDAVKIGIIAEHRKRKNIKEKLSEKEVTNLLKNKEEKIKEISEKIDEEKQAIYKFLFY